MSSLRLALKQSLQETGHMVPKDKKKKSKHRKAVNSHGGSGGGVDGGGSRRERERERDPHHHHHHHRRRSRQPGDPPRKRGRPRKHPVNDGEEGGDGEEEEHSGEEDRSAARHEDSEDRSDSENEFSYDSEEEEDDSEEEEEEEEDGEVHEEDEEESERPEEDNHSTTPSQSQSKGPSEDGEEDEGGPSTSSAFIKHKKRCETESDEERRRQKKSFKRELQQAANRIQTQWKKKKGLGGTSTFAAGVDADSAAVTTDGDDNSTTIQPSGNGYSGDEAGTSSSSKIRSSSPMPQRKHGGNPNATTPMSEKKKKKNPQTVPFPTPEVLDWSRNLSEKKYRKHAAAGLRVKVRFAAKVKRDGKVVKKKIWYGGRVSAVSKEGSKIRIKYDDGTSEISKFPDKDVVVDDTLNGEHSVPADKFIPPVIREEEHDEEEEEETHHETEAQQQQQQQQHHEEPPQLLQLEERPAADTTESGEGSVELKQSQPRPPAQTPVVPVAESKEPTAESSSSSSAPTPLDVVVEPEDSQPIPENIVKKKPAPTEPRAPTIAMETGQENPLVVAEEKVTEPARMEKSVAVPAHAPEEATKLPEKALESTAIPEPAPAPQAVGDHEDEEMEEGEVMTPQPKPEKFVETTAGGLPAELGSPLEEGEVPLGLKPKALPLEDKHRVSMDIDDTPKPVKPESPTKGEAKMDDQVEDSGEVARPEETTAASEAPQQDAIKEVATGTGKTTVVVNAEAKKDIPVTGKATFDLTEANETAEESPVTPKPLLTIRISNIKQSRNQQQEQQLKQQGREEVPESILTPNTPKTLESDSEEELFADTPVTERKVKSIQIKKKSKRKRDATDSASEDQPSKKKSHADEKESKKSDDNVGGLAIPQPEESSAHNKATDVHTAVEALSECSNTERADEDNKMGSRTLTISLRKPESAEEQLPMLPKLKRKKDRAASPVPKGRKSPGPRSRSPALFSVDSDGAAGVPTTEVSTESTEKIQKEPEKVQKMPPSEEVPSVDIEPVDPTRNLGSKTSAFSRKKGKKEAELEELQTPIAEGTREDMAESTSLVRSNGSTESLPSMRSGRRAAQQAKDKMTPTQEANEAESGKKKKKRKRKEGEDETDQSDESVDDRQWVQCDSCGKWRILPSHVKISDLPNNWYCHLNTYDAKRHSCVAPEQSAKQAAKEWRRARKRAKQQRLAELQATTEQEKSQGDSAKESKKDITPANSPKPSKGTKKERTESKRASPIGTEDSQTSNGRSDVVKAEKKGRKGKHHQQLEEAVDIAAPTLEPEAPKKPGRKRGRPARNQTPQKENGDSENVEWVQCEKCEKWRKLPPHISADELPDSWYCTMNTWNPNSASCEAIEDKADATHHEVGSYAGIYGGGAGKYSYRSMIFGTGKKHNRPMSERSRAAESLFMRPIDELENPYPTVMYSKSSCFLPRTSNFTKASAIEEEKSPTVFDALSNSELWSELRSRSQPMKVSSSTAVQTYPKYLSFDNLLDEVKGGMREVVLRSLGAASLTGDEVIREIQLFPWESLSIDLASIRQYFNADIIVNSLLALVRDGVVEMTGLRNYSLPMSQWVPKYRKVRSQRAMEIEESIKASRCMKIAKPWKQREENPEWVTGENAFS